MIRRSSARPQENHQVLEPVRAHSAISSRTKQSWRSLGGSQSQPATGGRSRRYGDTTTAIVFALASLACVLIVTDFVLYGRGSDRSVSLPGTALQLLTSSFSDSRGSSSLSRKMQVQKSSWPRAKRGRQRYRRVVALGDGDPNSAARVGADLYYLRDRKRHGPNRQFPKMVMMAPAHLEDREGFRRSLFWSIEHDKLKPMARRQLSLPFYNGLNLFAISKRNSQQDDKQSMIVRFGRILLDPTEDEARLEQQKLAIWSETEQYENDHSHRHKEVSSECMERAQVLVQLSTCNAFHERRVGDVDNDDDLSGNYLDLLTSRCECRL